MTALERAWDAQSIWSQVANGLKHDLERSRQQAWVLATLGALASAGGVTVGLDTTIGRVLTSISAVAIGLAGLAQRRASQEATQGWTRARSVAEALKAEVYQYLAGVGDYRDEGQRDGHLDQTVNEVVDQASDLFSMRDGVAPVKRASPAVHDVATYLDVRVRGQRDNYYRPQAKRINNRLRLLRQVQGAIAVCGIVLAALAGALERDVLAIWVPVVTTLGASIGAYAASTRYPYLLVEYSRTAEELDRVIGRSGALKTLSDDLLVAHAEHVISVQNGAWMIKLTSDPADAG